MQESRHSKSPEETQQIAQAWFQAHADVPLWLLEGNLGSGKTTFVQGLVGKAKSPTFTYLCEHPSLAHYDLYRLTQPDEELFQLIEDHLARKHVLIEWPQVLMEQLPKPYVLIQFETLDSGDRNLTLQVVR